MNPNIRRLIAVLKDAGWPEVAADVAQGVPLHVIASRLDDIGEGDSFAASAVNCYRAGVLLPVAEEGQRSAELRRRAQGIVRGAGVAGVPTVEVVRMVSKLDAMANAAMLDAHLDAADSLRCHVRLVLDEDPVLCGHVREMTRKHRTTSVRCEFCAGSGNAAPCGSEVQTYAPCPHCEGKGKRKMYPHELGDALCLWCREMSLAELGATTPLNAGETLTGAMLQVAFDYIDWRELAEEYIARESEEGGGDR